MPQLIPPYKSHKLPGKNYSLFGTIWKQKFNFSCKGKSSQKENNDIEFEVYS